MSGPSRWLSVLVTVLILLSSALGAYPALAQDASSSVPVLITFRQPLGMTSEAAASLSQDTVLAAGGAIVHRFRNFPGLAARVPASATNALVGRANIMAVEPDGVIWAIDAELDASWGVKRVGAGVVHGYEKGDGVKVAIVDTGIDYNHPDLDANFAGGWDFVNGDADPMDDNGHGTHVAGIIGAEDNGAGVVGMAPEAGLYALKVLGAFGSGSWSDLAAALDWAISNDMDVVNMSLGGESPPDLLRVAVEAAWGAGVVLVAAAGNNGEGFPSTVDYPAKYEQVIAVAATDSADQRASFSSTGPEVELAAPGVAVTSTYPGAAYISLSGTSMASPHTAGLAALIIGAGIADGNGDGRINDEVRQRMADTADDLGAPGRDDRYGWGLIDADESVISALAVTLQVAPDPVPVEEEVTASGSVADPQGQPVSGAQVHIDWGDGSSSDTATGAPGSYSATHAYDLAGTYTVTAVASKAGFGDGSATDTVTVTGPPPPPPPPGPVPIETILYPPTGFTLQRATLLSGGLGQLLEDDGDYLRLQAVRRDGQWLVEWSGSTRVEERRENILHLALTFNGSYSEQVTQELSAYNFSQGRWDLIDTRPVAGEDVTVEWLTKDFGPYLSQDGEVRLQARASHLFRRFEARGDLVMFAAGVGGGPLEDAYPASLVVERGEVAAGDPARLYQDDGSYLEIASVRREGQWRTDWYGAATLSTPEAFLARLEVAFDSGYTEPADRALYLWNFDEVAWEPLGQQEDVQEDTSFQWATGNPAPYISALGEVWLRAQADSALRYTERADLMRVRAQLLPPDIEVDPLALEATVVQGEVALRILTISNLGFSTLSFEISIQPPEAPGPTPGLPPVLGDISASPPPDLSPGPAVESLEGNPVLYLQDVNPWGSQAVPQVLNALGVPFDQAGSAALASIDLTQYQLVIVGSDQPQGFYNAFAANFAKFDSYVRGGGVLEFHGADQGWQSGFWSSLPGGVTHQWAGYNQNYVATPDHPILAGLDGDDLWGSYASHDHFLNLPEGATIITTDGAGLPTNIEYRLDAGTVIASGMTLEIAYSYTPGYFGFAPMLTNMISYALTVAPAPSPWLTIDPSSGTLAPSGQLDVAVTLDSTSLEPGEHRADLVISSNDPDENPVRVPVTLTVLPSVLLVDAGPDQSADEGDMVSLRATFNGVGPHEAEIDWGDGTVEPGVIADGTISGDHAYGDNGDYTVTVEVWPQDHPEDSASDSLQVAVANVAPAVEAGPDLFGAPGSPVEVEAAFSDPGWLDTHTAAIDWGDGTVDEVPPVYAEAAPIELIEGTIPGSHTYAAAGTYTVQVCVTDDDGDQGCDSLQAAIGEMGLADTPWPMFRHDLLHTGLSPYSGPETPAQKWSYATGYWVISSPAIGADGTLYVGSNDNNLYAINPDGSLKWSFDTGGDVESSPALGADGTIYVGSFANKLYAINPDGSEKWSYATGGGVGSSPALGADGTVYVGSYWADGKLYAINPDGSQRWSFATGGGVKSSPALGADGTVYVGSDDKKLYAINPDGSEKWSFATGWAVFSSPALGADGAIYVGSADNNLYAINPDGSLKWSFATGAEVISSPAIGADGTVYVGSYDNKLYAINPDGSQKWGFATGDSIDWSSPAIGADATVYVGSYDKKLYAINPDGTLKWSFATGSYVLSSPAIGADGTVYVGSADGKLYAIGEAPALSVTLEVAPDPVGVGGTATASGSVSGSGPVEGANVHIDWGDGAADDTATDVDGNYSATHAYSAAGTYTVTATASKAGYADGSAQDTVTVEDMGLADTPWPMFRHDLLHTGLSPYSGPSSPAQRWSFTTGGNVEPSPALGADGTVYVGSLDAKLYAINPDGSLKWSFATGSYVLSSPAVGADGTVYVGSTDNRLHAINPDGSLKWSFTTGDDVSSSPALGPDGTIYVGSRDYKLYAINPDGSEKWSFATGAEVYSSPALGVDGTIYVGSLDRNLYAINPDGTLKWSFTTGDVIGYSSPALGADGTIYVGSYDHNLYAINPDGSKRWSFATGGNVESSPALGADGTVYVGSENNSLYAINPDGTLKWSFTTGGGVTSSPALGADGTIYVGSDDNNLYAINPDGSLKWSFATGGWVYSSPALGADGTVYVGSWDGKLYAIGEAPPLAVTLDVSPDPALVNQTVTASGSVTGSGPVADAAVHIDWGDGSTSDTATDAAGSYSATHAYSAAGTYTVTAAASKAGYADGTATDTVTVTAAGLADTPWPMFRHDLSHTGLSPYSGPETPAEKWSFATGGVFNSSPAIGADGTIYAGSEGDNNLYALNPDGSERWRFATGGGVFSSPALGADGTIYIGSADNKLYAINPDGSLKWSFATGSHVWSSPALGADGTVYVGSHDNNLYAINPDGSQKWSYATDTPIDSSPAIGPDGTIYAGSEDFNLYAINPDGSLQWSFATGHFVNSSPALGADGTVYVGSFDNNLYAINPDGSLQWSFATGHRVSSSPAIGADGTIYVGSTDNNLYAINPDGSLQWSFATGGDVLSSPAIGTDGTIYVGSLDDKLYAINPDGSLKWSFATGYWVHSSPAIGADGTVYVGSADGKLYAIGEAPALAVTLEVAPDPVGVGGTATASGSVTGSGPVEGADVHIDWGDGSADDTTTDGSGNYSATHAYTAEGTYTVTATASKAGYADGSAQDTVTVQALGLADTPWPMFRHDLQHTGRSPYSGPETPAQKWSFTTGDYVISSPAIGADGTVYVGSLDHNLYALNPDGSEKWSFATGYWVLSSPAIAEDGTIFVGSIEPDNKLYAINPDGSEKWSFATGSPVPSSPAIGADGTIYVGSYDNSLYAINPDGSQKWSFATGNQVYSSPALGADGTVYMGSRDNKLYALNPDGSQRWSFLTGSEVSSSPALGADGTVYVGSQDNKLYAINPDGSQKWSFATGGYVHSSPAIGADGTVYVGSYDNKLYALNPDGSQKWSFTTGNYVTSSPAIGADGTVYVGSWDGKLYAIGEAGGAGLVEAGPDLSATEGQPLAFKGSLGGEMAAAAIDVATIYWGDGSSDPVTPSLGSGQALGMAASHVYPQDGAYTLTLCLEGPRGALACDSARVQVANLPPQVSASDVAGAEGSTVFLRASFSDLGGLDSHTATVDWGDGMAQQAPISTTSWAGLGEPRRGTIALGHTYRDDGTYTITISVTDDGGARGQATALASIANAPPAVVAGGPYAGAEGQPASIQASFADPGALDAHAATIDWGDGTAGPAAISGEGLITAAHAYAQDGAYWITVSVADDDGAVGQAKALVLVANAAPSLQAQLDPQPVAEGSPVRLGAFFADPGALDAHTAAVDWDDGSTSKIDLAGQGQFAAFHTYGDDGNYAIKVCITDDGGAQACQGLSAQVLNAAPVLTVGNQQKPGAPSLEGSLVATFSDASWLDTFSATIDWGDGTVSQASVKALEKIVGKGQRGEVRASHTYRQAGSYQVTLRLRDDDGGVASTSLTVTAIPSQKPNTSGG